MVRRSSFSIFAAAAAGRPGRGPGGIGVGGPRPGRPAAAAAKIEKKRAGGTRTSVDGEQAWTENKRGFLKKWL